MGILDTYTNSNFGKSNSIGGGGSFGSPRPTGRGRFSKYDYTASFADKEWSVSLGGIVVASDINSNTSPVNEQLARDWINSDWQRRKAIEAGNSTPLDPGLQDALDDSIDEEVIPDTSTDTVDTDTSITMTDNQRFLFLGVIVAAALFGFIKK